MKRAINIISYTVSLFLPAVAFAALDENSDIRDVIKVFTDLGLKAIPLLSVIALLVFVFGVGRFIKGTADGKPQDKSMLIWGVIAMFVLFSVWGIIAFLRSEFGFGDSVGIPQIEL